MKKISEWLEELPEPVRTNAKANFSEIGWGDQPVENLDQAVFWAFNWALSNEGYIYWQDIAASINNGDKI